jgi:hypothetical protein
VRVTSKAYRRVALYEPGEYVATLSYYNGTKTVANWVVKPLQQQKKAKNVILFIGDGMTTNMITAARECYFIKDFPMLIICRLDWTQEHQRQIPVNYANGQVSSTWPPNGEKSHPPENEYSNKS